MRVGWLRGVRRFFRLIHGHIAMDNPMRVKRVVERIKSVADQITTLDDAIRHAQEMTRRYVPEGVSLVDALHDTRRRDSTFG